MAKICLAIALILFISQSDAQTFVRYKDGVNLDDLSVFKTGSQSGSKAVSACSMICAKSHQACTAFNVDHKQNSTCNIYKIPRGTPLPRGTNRTLYKEDYSSFLSQDFLRNWGTLIDFTGQAFKGSGLANGLGSATLASSNFSPNSTLVFNGNWHMGSMDGTGSVKERKKFKNDSIVEYEYDGQWWNGLPDGQGTEIASLANAGYPDHKTTYKGEFEAGKWSGFGNVNYTWCSAEKNRGKVRYYKGNLLAGKYHGEGEVGHCLGDVYKGAFQNGLKEGAFTMSNSKLNRSFVGNFKDNKRHGHGVAISSDGKYEGQYRNGVWHGYGKQIDYNSRKTYVGEWVKGLREGLGNETSNNGQNVYIGSWKKNRRHGFGSCDDPNGSYEGEYKNGLRHGHGKLTSKKHRSVYEGGFVNNKREGQGLLYREEGQITYNGTWSKDFPVGIHTYKTKDGQVGTATQGEGRGFKHNHN